MSVPNTFTAGTLISAAQVNENFSYVDGGITALTSDINMLRGGTGPILLAITGQSNAVGINNGGNNPSNTLVNTWNPTNSTWVSGGQYTAAPWTSAAPTGNSSKNNFALSAAHYIAEKTGREVYIVFDAVSGQSITQWVPASQPRYSALKTKVEAALASSAMVTAGKTTIDFLIWAQGEENGAGTSAMDFATYTTYITNLDKQFRGDPADPVTYPGESWVEDFTPFYIMGMSPLHDRYMITAALQAFANKSNGRWRYLSTRNLRTQYQETGAGDYTHWLGPSLWDGGYYTIGPAFLDDLVVNQEADGMIFWGRSAPADAGSSTVIGSFSSFINWPSRIGGVLQETLSGNAVKTAFVLDYRGTTISRVTVDGVEKTSPADYSVSTDANTARNTITFTSAPATGTDNIVITYGAAINASAASNSFGWGYACYPDGNNSFTGGYIVATNNLSNYTFGWGRELYAYAAGDYGGMFGFNNNLKAPYGFVCGCGNDVSADGGFAAGLFTGFTDNSRLFQYGIGATTASRNNAIAVHSNGNVELYAPSTGANPGLTEQLTFRRISDSILRILLSGADGVVRAVDISGLSTSPPTIGGAFSGTYSPTVSNAVNCDSTPTVSGARYIGTGSVMEVSGTVSVDATASGDVMFRVTLPVPSNLVSTSDLSGLINSYSSAAVSGGAIIGSVSDDTAQFRLYATSTSARSYTFSFSYVVQ